MSESTQAPQAPEYEKKPDGQPYVHLKITPAQYELLAEAVDAARALCVYVSDSATAAALLPFVIQAHQHNRQREESLALFRKHAAEQERAIAANSTQLQGFGPSLVDRPLW